MSNGLLDIAQNNSFCLGQTRVSQKPCYLLHNQEEFIAEWLKKEMARMVQHLKSSNIIYQINRLKKKKSHDHINRSRKKAFDKIQFPSMIFKKTNSFSKLGIDGDFFNLIKNIYKNPKTNSILNVRNSRLSHSDQVQVKDVTSHHSLFTGSYC